MTKTSIVSIVLLSSLSLFACKKSGGEAPAPAPATVTEAPAPAPEPMPEPAPAPTEVPPAH